MLTENLINLFGGNDKPSKKNNNTIIIIIIIIICCCLLFSSSAFMMYNKKQEKKQDKLDNKEESKIDHCGKYNDDSIDYSDECIEQLFKNVGCIANYKDTFKPKFDESISKGQQKPPFEFIKKMFKTILFASDKEMCYGPDKTKWPVSKCEEYKGNSTNLSDNCINNIYSSVCPDFNINNVDPNLKDNMKKVSIKNLVSDALIMSYAKDDNTKNLCYGSDKSKWPTPTNFSSKFPEYKQVSKLQPTKCTGYTDNSKNVSDECITELFSRGCPAFDIKNISEEDKNKLKDTVFPMIAMSAALIPTSGTEKARTLCYGPDKSKWPAVCSHFQDDTDFVTTECIQDLWTKAGCTEPIPDPYKNTTGGTKFSTIKNNINTIAMSTDNATKSMCFGEDPSRSYSCSSLPDNAKFIPNKCVQELWTNGKCTKPLEQYKNGYIGSDNYTYSRVKDYINNQIKRPSDCEKLDSACDNWRETDTGIPTECLQGLWTSAGCTKPLPSEYIANFNNTLANNRTIFDDISKSTDPTIQSKCK
jgi:hypothetical protein